MTETKIADFEPKSFSIEKTLEGYPPRTNFNVIQLDQKYNVRIAEIIGRFPWHRHTNGDEGWIVWKGRLQIDFENGKQIVLGPGEGSWIPQGIFHSPLALAEGTQVIVFNVDQFEHEYRDEKPDVGDFSINS